MFRRTLYLLMGIILVFCLALITNPCNPEGLIQKVDDSGAIDWGRLVVRCTGVGSPSPEAVSAPNLPEVIKSAQSDALERLLKTLRQIPITSQTSVNQVMQADDALRDRVRELVRKFREVRVHYMSDGSVEMDVELCLSGELMDLMLPPTGGGKRIPDGLLCPLCGQPWPEGREVPPDIRLDRPQGVPPKPFTGLVIDARGLGLNPALAPKVLNEMGKTVYGVGFAKRPRSLVEGIVGYEQNLAQARERERVASNPLVVEGLKAWGAGKTDVVIANDQAALLHCMPEHLQFMEECRVIVVLD